MSENDIRRALCIAIILLLSLFLAASAAADSLIFNNNLSVLGPKAPRPSVAHVERLRASGWKCPEWDKWPAWWDPKGTNVTFQAFPRGGKLGAYCSISGKDGYIVCGAYPLKDWLRYVKKEEDQKKYGEDHLFSIWARGKGIPLHLNLHCLQLLS